MTRINKMCPRELFVLSPIIDDPRFEGFALDDNPSVLGREDLHEDVTPGFGQANKNPRWKPVQLNEKWPNPKAYGRVTPFNDYPCINMSLPAFSKRACEVLKTFLEPNGELLPLRTETKGQYFFYNITTIVDALDVPRSRCNFWCNPPTTATSIDYFAFNESKLKGLSIFRIYELPQKVIVSDGFARCVEDHGLNGFEFAKIWPLESKQNWRKLASVKRRQQRGPSDVKNHTLVLIFPLSKKTANRSEKSTIAQLEDDLDAQLVTHSLNMPYFGSYEGNDFVEGECRLFLSCPNVDRLVLKLQPWLENINWPKSIFVVKRFGRMYDENAEEKILEF